MNYHEASLGQIKAYLQQIKDITDAVSAELATFEIREYIFQTLKAPNWQYNKWLGGEGGPGGSITFGYKIVRDYLAGQYPAINSEYLGNIIGSAIQDFREMAFAETTRPYFYEDAKIFKCDPAPVNELLRSGARMSATSEQTPSSIPTNFTTPEGDEQESPSDQEVEAFKVARSK